MIVACIVLAGGVAFGLLLLATPSVSDARTLVRAQAITHGVAYPGPAAPRRFTEALVATEDHRFFLPFDPGVDPVAIARVSLYELARHRGDPGGSTIAQQLAKMLYVPEREGFTGKLERVALAIKLSFSYSRSEILSMYAEVAYFGDGYYGLAAASCGYFGKRPADLSWAQAATLAGVVNAPSADDPRTHPDAARSRATHVFDRLVAVGDLARAQATASLSEPFGLRADKGAEC
ncbi:MAG TPA: biosynthetic peptidoglycan transglycosylase [Roseiarcus sp.]|nr:biosynthetic peptidoglycan transglycosylase [Roseiarcus sp.]